MKKRVRVGNYRIAQKTLDKIRYLKHVGHRSNEEVAERLNLSYDLVRSVKSRDWMV